MSLVCRRPFASFNINFVLYTRHMMCRLMDTWPELRCWLGHQGLVVGEGVPWLDSFGFHMDPARNECGPSAGDNM